MKNSKSGLHPRNKHKSGYDFKVLLEGYPHLKPFVIQNDYGNVSVDFSDPFAVKELNKALLKVHYGIDYWDFSDDNLCPPIPGRVDYIHHIADLIKSLGINKDITILDIGTGATCIYPLLGVQEYNWNFVCSDIESDSLIQAQRIIDENHLAFKISLRHQNDQANILTGIIENGDLFSVAMCNPPFYKSEAEAQGANRRKSKNLGNNIIRNFSGVHNELWYPGGEKAFLHNYLYQSSLYKEQLTWCTSLVSSKENVKSLENSSKKLKVKDFKVIPMHQGNKVARIVAWRF